jgi:hypothetical protein
MASNSLLTYGSKVSNVEQVYYAPTVVLPPLLNNLSSLYCLLAKVDGWSDDNNPPDPSQDQKNIKSFLKNVFVAKQITNNDISPVIQRINWVSGTVYEYYRDDIDMFQVDVNGFLIYPFYIINRYNQVFKCLWNGNGNQSTFEPYFEPGSYNTNGIYQNSDAYKWKYMYTVDTHLSVKFMDSSWIPVAANEYAPNPIVTSEGYGALEVINVLNGGQGYDPTNSVISLVVTGDGTGASGFVSVNVSAGGTISDIIINTPGQNYTYANAIITSANGSGAILAANVVSPIGGHGFDPISELGCHNVMFSIEFNGAETLNGVNYIPTDIIYHQVGIVVNPTSLSSSPNPANSPIYNTATQLNVSNGFGLFVNDEIVFQTDKNGNKTFIGTVLSFNTSTNQLSVINTTGSLVSNAPIYGNTSGTARTLLTLPTPLDFVTLSGNLIYLENRSGIQRSPDGIEQFKIVLGY